MKQIRIKDPAGEGFYDIWDVEDFEYVNPIKKMHEVYMAFYVKSIMDLILLSPAVLPSSEGVRNPEKIIEKVASEQAEKYCKEDFDNVMSIILPDNLLNIFKSKQKKDQFRALKGVTLGPSQILKLIYHAWLTHNYRYSTYVFHHNHKGSDPFEMPHFAYKTGSDQIIVGGSTKLTEGQIRSAIDQRNVVVAKFLDNGIDWHCFLLTYRSVGGKEVGNTPHIHYISSAFGLSREEVLIQFNRKRYKLPKTPHISYKRDDN